VNETSNLDPREIDHFDRFGEDWWNPDGSFRTLHDINPVRLAFVERHAMLAGARVLDVGCGGGILALAMASRGASVLGIDMSEAGLTAAARQATANGPHADASGGARTCEFRRVTVEALADESQQFDVVTCMEMLEHVPDPASIIAACARLTRPGGTIYLSTLNRTPKAWALAVVGAEYVLGLLPRGTHDYGKFLRPSEIDRVARASALELVDLRGMHYNPVSRRARLSTDVSVNYLAAYRAGGTAAP
jgi:2-polyprenyl-6-hydroxyphenyl methylase/3-demethylubiquinone-9 3-methyltransferase